MNDEVIPLEKLGKRGTVRVYTQSYVEQLKKENAELKAYNEKLLDGDIEKHNKIVELQNRNGELAGQKASLGRWLGEAKEIIKEFVRVEYADFTNGDYSNELSKVLERAEDFLKESEQF